MMRSLPIVRRLVGLPALISILILTIASVAGCDDGGDETAKTGGGGNSSTTEPALTAGSSMLLVTDIDDTIKATGIHSVNVVAGALSTTKEFAGTSLLYQRWRTVKPSGKSITYLRQHHQG